MILICATKNVDKEMVNRNKSSTNRSPPKLVGGFHKWLIYGKRTDNNGSYMVIISGWWLNPTPLKNDGVRQLG